MGSEAERALVDRVASIGGQNVRGITGRLALMEYAAFIRMARLFVANSTGPLHVAAAVGTPVIGFYPSDRVMGPGRWGPLTPAKTIFVPQEKGCARCASGACDAHGAMARIAVETVAAAAQRMLGADGSERTKRRPRSSSRRARVRR